MALCGRRGSHIIPVKRRQNTIISSRAVKICIPKGKSDERIERLLRIALIQFSYERIADVIIIRFTFIVRSAEPFLLFENMIQRMKFPEKSEHGNFNFFR